MTALTSEIIDPCDRHDACKNRTKCGKITENVLQTRERIDKRECRCTDSHVQRALLFIETIQKNLGDTPISFHVFSFNYRDIDRLITYIKSTLGGVTDK